MHEKRGSFCIFFMKIAEKEENPTCIVAWSITKKEKRPLKKYPFQIKLWWPPKQLGKQSKGACRFILKQSQLP